MGASAKFHNYAGPYGRWPAMNRYGALKDRRHVAKSSAPEVVPDFIKKKYHGHVESKLSFSGWLKAFSHEPKETNPRTAKRRELEARHNAKIAKIEEQERIQAKKQADRRKYQKQQRGLLKGAAVAAAAALVVFFAGIVSLTDVLDRRGSGSSSSKQKYNVVLFFEKTFGWVVGAVWWLAPPDNDKGSSLDNGVKGKDTTFVQTRKDGPEMALAHGEQGQYTGRPNSANGFTGGNRARGKYLNDAYTCG